MTIRVKPRLSDNFGDPISEVFRIIQKIVNCPAGEDIEIDFCGCLFSYPFVLTACAILGRNGYLGRNIKIKSQCDNPGFNDYLKLINFPEGFNPENAIPNSLTEYETKTYIPIVKFPAQRINAATSIRDQFLSAINQLLYKQLGLTGSLKIAVSYLIDEAVANIVDHSKEINGFIFAQYYRTKNFMDVCIGDGGIGILKSYHNLSVPLETDSQAIQNAISGISTKNEGRGRGFGIRTSKQMLVQGLSGKYFLLTGGAFLAKNREIEDLVALPKPIYWPGTILLLRIPIMNNSEFNPALYYDV